MAAFAGLSAQCSVREVPLVQRANASSLIVEGTVTEQYSYWNTSHTMIYTASKIELYKIFKGSVNTDAIEIITEGGTVDMDRITVEPTLQLTVGDVGVFTCIAPERVQNNVTSRNALPQYEAYASLQGFVQYDLTDNTASDHFRTYTDIQTELFDVCAPAGYTEVKVRPGASTNRIGDQLLAPLVINSFLPTTLTAGTGTQITIDGAGFGSVQGTSVVRFRNADDGGSTFITPLASQYISWSSTQIIVEVPQNAGTGVIQVFNGSATATSSGTLTITYAHLNVDFDPGPGTIAYQTDHVNDDGSGGYTWRMNTGFDGDASARASFMRAFDTWRCATLVNWSIGTTTSINDAVSDGTNIICFDNTAPLSAGILGVCYSYWSGCANGPTIIWYVNELDIIFDEGSNISPLTWEYGPATPSGSEYDFETVAVHELGHGHQLGHVIAPGAIMHYAISNGTSNRSLSANDLAGGQFVQAKSVVSNVCGPGAMSNTTCGSPPVAAFMGSPTTVCAGGTVSFTDQSTGTPTSWLWSFTGGSPSSSTSQNPTVIYNTPGVYDVTLTATNINGSDPHTINGYITVNANPGVGFSASPSLTICAGDAITLSGTGASSYGWSGGVNDGVPFSPSSTGSYTVTGTDGNGCTATDVANVTVNTASVNITRNPSNGIVCSGNQATLTATGAQSYLWTGGITNGVAFTPVSTTTYTVTATAANGCTTTGQSTITVQSCSGPVSTVPCGISISNKNQTASAANVSGAVQYRFRFYNNVSLALVGTVTQASRTLTFSSVPGVFFGNTYRWTVAVNTGSGFGAESSMNCTVTFAVPTATLPCGTTYNRFNGYSAVTGIVGSSGYRFTFYDMSMVQVAQVTQASNYIYFNNVSQLTVGGSYRWTVEVQYNNGSGTVFGPASNSSCTVFMAAPTTTVPCNATYNRQNGYTAAGAATAATGYRFTFYQGATMVAQRAQTSNYIYFSQVSGIYNGQTYQWTVEVQYNNGSGNVYGPASTPCNITFSAPARLAGPAREDAVEEQPAMSFAMSMYPNPLGDNQAPTLVVTGADQKDAVVTVMDLTGRVITSYMMYCEGEQFTAQLSGFPDLVAGMYIMQVTVGDQVQSQRFVAE